MVKMGKTKITIIDLLQAGGMVIQIVQYKN